MNISSSLRRKVGEYRKIVYLLVKREVYKVYDILLPCLSEENVMSNDVSDDILQVHLLNYFL